MMVRRSSKILAALTTRMEIRAGGPMKKKDKLKAYQLNLYLARRRP